MYTTPVPGSGEGTVVFDHYFLRNKEIVGPTLKVENGKITSMTAPSGIEPLKAPYDAWSTGKEELGFFDLGVNTSLEIPEGNKLSACMPGGMVSLGWGNNVRAGGNNRSDGVVSGFLPGSTVTIDGLPLVKKGALSP